MTFVFLACYMRSKQLNYSVSTEITTSGAIPRATTVHPGISFSKLLFMPECIVDITNSGRSHETFYFRIQFSKLELCLFKIRHELRRSGCRCSDGLFST